MKKALLFSILFAIAFLPIAKGCHLYCTTFYQTYPCLQPTDACDWVVDVGGCAEGIYAGQLYFLDQFGACHGPEAKWKGYPGNNGDICKVRDGASCFDVIIEGRYDATEGKCVQCTGRTQTRAVKCGMYDDTTKKCESACGADSQCDEKLPHSYDGYTKYCDSNCYFNECKESTQCKKADEYYCTYVYNYAGYTGWAWTLSLSEDGSPWQECFDEYYDNDCDEEIDCADESCKGVKNPNTGDICCQSDVDCPGGLTCDTSTHKCRKRCGYNSECKPRWCCLAPSAGGPGGDSCVEKGYHSGIYLCDPPEWNIDEKADEPDGISQLILKFFYQLFTKDKFFLS